MEKNEIVLSYLLDTNHWGYGYALECCRAVFTYAKEELDIKRIVAVIDKKNTRSQNTAKESWHDNRKRNPIQRP